MNSVVFRIQLVVKLEILLVKCSFCLSSSLPCSVHVNLGPFSIHVDIVQFWSFSVNLIEFSPCESDRVQSILQSVSLIEFSPYESERVQSISLTQSKVHSQWPSYMDICSCNWKWTENLGLGQCRKWPCNLVMHGVRKECGVLHEAVGHKLKWSCWAYFSPRFFTWVVSSCTDELKIWDRNDNELKIWDWVSAENDHVQPMWRMYRKWTDELRRRKLSHNSAEVSLPELVIFGQCSPCENELNMCELKFSSRSVWQFNSHEFTWSQTIQLKAGPQFTSGCQTDNSVQMK
jgi:hypothetical protein